MRRVRLTRGGDHRRVQTARNDTIDGFRALAILVVMGFHYTVRWTPPQNGADLYGYGQAYPGWLELGRFGVDVFFVISGFVIAMTVSRCATAAEFGWRRLARLYPAYVACATITFVVMAAVGPAVFKVSAADWLANFTMAAPLAGHAYVDGAYWSLLVEVKFYAAVAVSFLVLRQRFWIGLAGLAVVGAAVARSRSVWAEAWLIAPYMPLFLLGMAGWLWIEAGRRGAAAACLATAAVTYAATSSYLVGGLFAPALRMWGHVAILGPSLVMLGLLSLRPLDLGPLGYLGRCSYSLYLLHQKIGVTVIGLLTPFAPDAVAMAGAAGVCVAGAVAMYELVEKPAQRGLTGLWRRRAAAWHGVGKTRGETP